jgi:hypothetical protein
MARVDDYIEARHLAIETLSRETFEQIARRSGFEIQTEDRFKVSFLNRVYSISFPAFEFSDSAEAKKEVPIQEQVLILHYMMGTGSMGLSQKWIAYREIEGASFYFSAFVKRAVDPLKKVFGQNLKGFTTAAKTLGGNPIQFGDAGFEFNPFPRVPVQLIVWEGDDEFPAEANILFDQTVGAILSPEDIAWLAGMIVYRMIKIAHT